MAIEIIVPTLGESVSDATVARWIKTTGDNVAADEPVVELETDKVTLEVPAPAAGQIGDIVAAEGSVVEVGAILARLEEGVGGAPAKPAKNVAETPAEKPAGKICGACYRTRCSGSSSASRRGEPRSLVASCAPSCDRT